MADDSRLILEALNRLEAHLNTKIDSLTLMVSDMNGKLDVTSKKTERHEVHISNLLASVKEQETKCDSCVDAMHGSIRKTAGDGAQSVREVRAELVALVTTEMKESEDKIFNRVKLYFLSTLLFALLSMLASAWDHLVGAMIK